MISRSITIIIYHNITINCDVTTIITCIINKVTERIITVATRKCDKITWFFKVILALPRHFFLVKNVTHIRRQILTFKVDPRTERAIHISVFIVIVVDTEYTTEDFVIRANVLSGTRRRRDTSTQDSTVETPDG